HQMLQLERVCRLFAGTGLLGAGRVEGEEPLRRLRLLAFQFVLDADAWKLLSAELRLDPEAILRHLPGCDLVRDVEEAARAIAFTAEEALACLRAQPEAAEAAGEAPARREQSLDTAVDVARGMREFLAERARRWP